MTQRRLAHIVRHPIKSVGFQQIERAALTQGRPLPFDRLWAIATEAAGFATDGIEWCPKTRFVRGAAAGSLQAITADFDPTSGKLTLTHPRRPPFHGTLPQDGGALVAWVRPLWPDTRPAPASVVARADGGALSDVPDPWIAVLNLRSNAVLGARMNRVLSIHRWRGNLWIDGGTAWEEFDWIGREIQIGGARLRVEARITRCVATTFDPATGHPDGDTLAALEHGWDHRDFGVYASVTQSGTLALNDEVNLLP